MKAKLGQDVSNVEMAFYLAELAGDKMMVNKFDDALIHFKEALSILNSLSSISHDVIDFKKDIEDKLKELD